MASNQTDRSVPVAIRTAQGMETVQIAGDGYTLSLAHLRALVGACEGLPSTAEVTVAKITASDTYCHRYDVGAMRVTHYTGVPA